MLVNAPGFALRDRVESFTKMERIESQQVWVRSWRVPA